MHRAARIINHPFVSTMRGAVFCVFVVMSKNKANSGMCWCKWYSTVFLLIVAVYYKSICWVVGLFAAEEDDPPV